MQSGVFIRAVNHGKMAKDSRGGKVGKEGKNEIILSLCNSSILGVNFGKMAKELAKYSGAVCKSCIIRGLSGRSADYQSAAQWESAFLA